jgi:tRNA pseudouridine55 synthase
MTQRSNIKGPSGFLVIDKPAGITSFDVIRELRRILKIRKLGHSGVLDKPATGVLVVGANTATRLFELFGSFEKEYRADLWFGISTTTDDLTGELVKAFDSKPPTKAELESALNYYTGTIDQIPPAFSLTKKGGKELYRYALAGQDIEVEPKRVTILSAELLEYETDLEPAQVISPASKLEQHLDKLPSLSKATVHLRCVGGVYVRSLARDIGADLGVGGTLGHLVRTRVGPYAIDDAVELTQLGDTVSNGVKTKDLFQPLSSIAPPESRLNLDPAQLSMVRNGRSIRRFKHHLPAGAQIRGDLVFGMDPGNDLAAVLTVAGINQHGLVELKPAKVISS